MAKQIYNVTGVLNTQGRTPARELRYLKHATNRYRKRKILSATVSEKPRVALSLHRHIIAFPNQNDCGIENLPFSLCFDQGSIHISREVFLI